MDSTRLTLSLDEETELLPASATLSGEVQPALLFEIVRALRLVGVGVELHAVSPPRQALKRSRSARKPGAA